jgi:Meiotically up-regulated gene 113
MKTSKRHILAEIKRLTESRGKPPGVRLFESETGIKESDWFPDLWLRWGDALQEAGFTRNTMVEAFSDELLIQQYARLARKLSRLPLQGEMIRESKANPEFPSEKAYRRFGGKTNLLNAVAKYCRATAEFDDVLAFCENAMANHSSTEVEIGMIEPKVGYVYMLRHGSRREYKIGRTNNPIRREGEISVELPQKLEPIHVITTDDPSGVESYWHRRFEEKRLKNEWFALTADDVRAFKRWQRIV